VPSHSQVSFKDWAVRVLAPPNRTVLPRTTSNAIAVELRLGFTRCTGPDCRSMVVFDAAVGDPLEMKSLVQQELVKRGILWGGFHNLSYSHTDEDVEHTLAAYREVLPILGAAVSSGSVFEALRGEPVEPTFRRVSGFNSKPRPAVVRM